PHFLADRARVPVFAVDGATEEIEVTVVAYDFGCPRQGRARLRSAPCWIPRADTDDGELSPRPTDCVSADRIPCAGDGAGCAPRVPLGPDQGPLTTDGRARCPFRDTPTAGGTEHRLRALGEARRLGEEARGGKKPRRRIEFRRQGMNRVFGKLQLYRR